MRKKLEKPIPLTEEEIEGLRKEQRLDVPEEELEAILRAPAPRVPVSRIHSDRPWPPPPEKAPAKAKKK